MRKLRILFQGEAHPLNTGYAVYTRNVLGRLFASQRYEIAEIGVGMQTGQVQSPWAFYGTIPQEGTPEHEIWARNPDFNSFGGYLFEKICAEFLPDVVIGISDPWMMGHMYYSPFKRFYELALMPAVDGDPQNDEWLGDYLTADAVFGYTDWALALLRKQSQGKIKTKCSAPPGADLKVYRPLDKKEAKASLNIEPDALVIGAVMRNQKRKLIPQLVQDFATLYQSLDETLKRRVWLYMHTSYPDRGWDIPSLLKNSGVAHRILFTYWCRNCGAVFASVFEDAHTFCRHCGVNAPSCGMSFPQQSIGDADLVRVFNSFDAFVNYSALGAFEMPIAEAAACGVPGFATDYSGMSDVIRKVGGTPIEVAHLSKESETGRLWAIPKSSDFVEKLRKFLSLPQVHRNVAGQRARRAAETAYDYDKTAQIWADYLDTVSLRDIRRWAEPPQVLQIPEGLPNLPPAQLVEWATINILGRAELINSYFTVKRTKDLNTGAQTALAGGPSFNDLSVVSNLQRLPPYVPQNLYQEFAALRNKWNADEIYRFEVNKERLRG